MVRLIGLLLLTTLTGAARAQPTKCPATSSVTANLIYTSVASPTIYNSLPFTVNIYSAAVQGHRPILRFTLKSKASQQEANVFGGTVFLAKTTSGVVYPINNQCFFIVDHGNIQLNVADFLIPTSGMASIHMATEGVSSGQFNLTSLGNSPSTHTAGTTGNTRTPPSTHTAGTTGNTHTAPSTHLHTVKTSHKYGQRTTVIIKTNNGDKITPISETTAGKDTSPVKYDTKEGTNISLSTMVPTNLPELTTSPHQTVSYLSPGPDTREPHNPTAGALTVLSDEPAEAPGAVAIGGTSIALSVVFILVIVLLDLGNIVNDCRRGVRRVKWWLKRCRNPTAETSDSLTNVEVFK